MKTRIQGGSAMNDYPPTEYDDWQRARGHMSGTAPLRTLEQARADLAEKNTRARQYVAGCIEELMRESAALGEDVDFMAAVHAARLPRGG